MAIDIKELRKGSHILYEGKIVAVCDIYAHGFIGVRTRSGNSIIADAFRYEPVLITEGILRELGFVDDTSHGFTARKKFIDGQTAKYRNNHDDAFMTPRISLSYDEVSNPFWRVTVLGKHVTDYNAAVHYLHELENFLYLANRIELIKE